MFLGGYIEAHQLDLMRRLVADPFWNPEKDREILERFQNAIHEMPDAIIEVSIAWVKDSFQRYYDETLELYNYFYDFYENFGSLEADLFAQASGIGEIEDLSGFLEFILRLNPVINVGWTLYNITQGKFDLLELIGVIQLVGGISRLTRFATGRVPTHSLPSVRPLPVSTTRVGSANNVMLSATGSPSTRGILRATEPGVWQSRAGLIYGYHPRDGNRINHILRHTVDMPNRNFPHGVFDADRRGTLSIIDEAWQIARGGGSRVQIIKEGDATIYIVNMGRRIGYVGGRPGAALGYPEAMHIRLYILNDARLVSAYPYNP